MPHASYTNAPVGVWKKWLGSPGKYPAPPSGRTTVRKDRSAAIAPHLTIGLDRFDPLPDQICCTPLFDKRLMANVVRLFRQGQKHPFLTIVLLRRGMDIAPYAVQPEDAWSFDLALYLAGALRNYPHPHIRMLDPADSFALPYYTKALPLVSREETYLYGPMLSSLEEKHVRLFTPHWQVFTTRLEQIGRKWGIKPSSLLAGYTLPEGPIVALKQKIDLSGEKPIITLTARDRHGDTMPLGYFPATHLEHRSPFYSRLRAEQWLGVETPEASSSLAWDVLNWQAWLSDPAHAPMPPSNNITTIKLNKVEVAPFLTADLTGLGVRGKVRKITTEPYYDSAQRTAGIRLFNTGKRGDPLLNIIMRRTGKDSTPFAPYGIRAEDQAAHDLSFYWAGLSRQIPFKYFRAPVAETLALKYYPLPLAFMEAGESYLGPGHIAARNPLEVKIHAVASISLPLPTDQIEKGYEFLTFTLFLREKQVLMRVSGRYASGFDGWLAIFALSPAQNQSPVATALTLTAENWK